MADETTPNNAADKPADNAEAAASETTDALNDAAAILAEAGKAAQEVSNEATSAAATERQEAAKEEKEEKTEKRGGGDRAASDDIFAEIAGDAGEEKVKIHKAKGSKNITRGIVHVSATFNNTLVSVTDTTGNVIGWASAGKLGFKGSRKSTAYAAQEVSKDACRQAMSHGLREVDVRVKGPGSGRESAVRAVQALGIEILSISDVTPVPHNGCRPPKARRV